MPRDGVQVPDYPDAMSGREHAMPGGEHAVPGLCDEMSADLHSAAHIRGGGGAISSGGTVPGAGCDLPNARGGQAVNRFA